jgi:hypothetical protein
MEVAKLLKKAGFDWKCKYAYIITPAGDMPTGEEGTLTEYVENVNWLVKSPTLEVAQKWLREVKNIQIIASPLAGSKKWTPLICKDFWLLHEDLDGIALTPENFDSYELAQESGIKKALEKILECK